VAAVVSLALILVVAIAPVAQAQSPTPSQFCTVLTPQEVSTALGVDVTIADSTDIDCTYNSDFAAGTFTSLNVRFEDSFDLEIMKSVFTDATEITVAGQPALITADSSLLYTSLPNGGALTLQLVGSAADGVDVAAAMTSLAELAVPRLASIALPTAEPVPSIPTYHQDPELEAQFPATVGGQPIEVQSVAGDMVSQVLGNNPEDLQQLTDFLSSIGKSVADLSVGVGFVTGPPAASIIAVRIKGTDMASITPQIMPLLTSNLTDPQQTPAQVGGKNVTKLNEAGAPDEQAQYIYPHGDVLWTVSSVDPALTEIFGALP
jgi:hypothetical protein